MAMVMTTSRGLLDLWSTSWRPYDMELPRDIFLYTSVTFMWRLYRINRDVINTYDDTIYNLLAYVCDWSLDAHKIMHPILSLKSGVTLRHDGRWCVRCCGASSVVCSSAKVQAARWDGEVAGRVTGVVDWSGAVLMRREMRGGQELDMDHWWSPQKL